MFAELTELITALRARRPACTNYLDPDLVPTEVPTERVKRPAPSNRGPVYSAPYLDRPTAMQSMIATWHEVMSETI